MNGRKAKDLRKQALLFVGVKNLKSLVIPGYRECEDVTHPKTGKFLGYRFRDGKAVETKDHSTIVKYTYKAIKKFYKLNFVHG